MCLVNLLKERNWINVYYYYYYYYYYYFHYLDILDVTFKGNVYQVYKVPPSKGIHDNTEQFIANKYSLVISNVFPCSVNNLYVVTILELRNRRDWKMELQSNRFSCCFRCCMQWPNYTVWYVPFSYVQTFTLVIHPQQLVMSLELGKLIKLTDFSLNVSPQLLQQMHSEHACTYTCSDINQLH